MEIVNCEREINRNKTLFKFFLLVITFLTFCLNFEQKKENDFIALDYIHPIQFPKEYFQLVQVEIISSNSNNIPILMYHSIESPKFWIDRQTFRNHLKLLFDAGFSTMKIEDYLKEDFSHIPDGRKPVILTFDDQWGSQFYFDDVDGKNISNQSAVGILEEFAKLHPDFGKNAVFYLFFHRLPFQSYPDHNLWKKKITYLLESGFEIGSHTYDHSIMKFMNSQKINKELDQFYFNLEPLVGKYLPNTFTLAYPGGIVPFNKQTVVNYRYKYHAIKAGLLAGSGFAKVPATKNKDLLAIPRMLGSTEQIQWIIQQPTFTVKREIITIPKIFTTSSDIIADWLYRKQKNNLVIFKELNP